MKHYRRALTYAMQGLFVLSGCAPANHPPGEAPAAAAEHEAASATVRFADIATIRGEIAARVRLGQPTLLNFWATWCEPCVDELAALASAADNASAVGANEDQQLEVVGVSLDGWKIGSESEMKARVLATLERQGVDYPNIIYRGEPRPLLDAFGLPGPIPYSILYDADGRVAKIWNGPVVIRELFEQIARMNRSEGWHDAGGGADPDTARQNAS